MIAKSHPAGSGTFSEVPPPDIKIVDNFCRSELVTLPSPFRSPIMFRYASFMPCDDSYFGKFDSAISIAVKSAAVRWPSRLKSPNYRRNGLHRVAAENSRADSSRFECRSHNCVNQVSPDTESIGALLYQ